MNIAKPCCRLVPGWLAVLVFPFLCSSSFSAPLDFGVDPEHLGTGEWVYVMKDCVKQLGGPAENVNDAPSMFQFFKKHGVDYVAVKAGTGAKDFPSADAPQFTPELVKQAHDAGLRIFGYSRSDGKDVPGEIALACKVNAMGADGFIIDAEAEWESHKLDDRGPALAIQLCQGIRKAYPTRFLGHAPMPIISKHSSFPYKEFGRYCDATMPQAYWKSIGVSPKRMVQWMEEEWHDFNKSLMGDWTNAIKPLAPIAQAWSPTPDRVLRGVEILEFANELKGLKNPASPTGYKGISYWRCDLHTRNMWKAIRRVDILKSRPTPLTEEDQEELAAMSKQDPAISKNPTDIIIDNNHANFTLQGKWVNGKMKPKLFGSNYECVGSVAKEATAKAKFTPAITKAGNYDVYVWYPADLSKSGKVPYTIVTQDKSERVLVDQTVNGGQWNLIASEKFFDEGTNGYVVISNDLGDKESIIVADAVRFRLSLAPDQPAPPLVEPTPKAVAPVVEAAPVQTAPPPVAAAPAVVEKVKVEPTPAPAPAPKPAAAAVPSANNNAKPDKAASPRVEVSPGMVVAKAEIIVDAKNPNVVYEGTWHTGKMASGFYTEDYQWASTSEGAATASATFYPDIRVAGAYNVYAWHTVSSNRTRNAHWEIKSANGTERVRINQRARGGKWVLLAANKQFNVGKSGYVKLSNDTGEHGAGENTVIADAVRLVLKSQDKGEVAETVAPAATPPPTATPAVATPVAPAPRATPATQASKDTAAKFAAVERDLLIDNLNPEVTFEGKWGSENIMGCFGADCMTAKAASGASTASAIYRPTINVPGNYDVYVWYPQNPNNSTNAQWLVSWNGGNEMVAVDQSRNGGQWVLIASAKPFVAGNGGSVTLFNDTADAHRIRKVAADAVRLRLHPAEGSISTR